jgi:hypothetical protein
VRTKAAVAVAALMLPLVGGCGDGGSVATTGPTATTTTVDSGSTEVTLADLEAQEQAWLAARPPAYEYEIETSCDCPLAERLHVVVEGVEVVRAAALAPGDEPYLVRQATPLEALFPRLAESLALAEAGEISTGRTTATFDPTYGFPTSWTVTGSGGLPSHRGEVRAFAPLNPGTLARPPSTLSLVVSNQSLDVPDVGLHLTVDGQTVVQRRFAVGSQHTFVGYLVPLEVGPHELVARASTGATATHAFTTTAAGRRHVYVAFAGPDGITVRESDQPFAFG